MHNLVEVVGLERVLESVGIDYADRNFEEVYSGLWSEDPNSQCIEEIKTKVYDYFSKMRLPDSPTLYDQLVLSLRNKDVIATFNWDPFLYDACVRNAHVAEPPHVIFLHGNVRLGCCLEHSVKGVPDSACPKCSTKPLTRSPLLFRVGEKNYQEHPLIADEWARLRRVLGFAFTMTIFGYSAPVSDKEAVGLMKDAWSGERDRQFEEIEIIDLKSEDELYETWKRFIFSHHWQRCGTLGESFIGQHPRRTCEVLLQQTVEAKFVESNPYKEASTLEDMWDWFDELLRAEN